LTFFGRPAATSGAGAAPRDSASTLGSIFAFQGMAKPDPNHLTTHLLSLAAARPLAPALLAPGRVAMTFGELADRIGLMVVQLTAWGFGRGDVIAWPTEERGESAAALAIIPASATLAPLARDLTVADYQALLKRLRPKAVASMHGRDHAIVRAARNLGIAQLAVVPEPHGVAGAFRLELAQPLPSLEMAPVVTAETAYISTTSGTTNRQKLVPHGERQLMATARAKGERLMIGPGDVSGHVAPLHLAAGLRTSLLLSLLNGGAVACLPESDVDALLAALARDEITYVSASFTIMREMLRRAESGYPIRTGKLRFLRASAGRLEPDEIDRLAAAFGVPVVVGLASTETGTVAQQGLPPDRRNPGSVGPPLACEIRLVNEHGNVAAPGESGEIQVRGTQTFDGYIDDLELNAQAFVDGWFRMEDIGLFDAAGELHVIGRVAEIINRGGEKISPLEIDAVLLALPGVVDAAAFAIPHPRLGEELVAAVVRAPESKLEAKAAIAQVRAKLGARRAPRQIWFVASLPRNAAGKLLRGELPEWVGHSSASKRAEVQKPMPMRRSSIEIALTGLWANALGLVQVGRDDNFFMLGGDSLRGAQLLDEVSAVFGVTLLVNALFEDAGSVAAMAARIETERARSASHSPGWTIPRRPAHAVVPLTSMQARSWFLQRLDPDAVAYHEARLWRIDGELDVDALRTALAAVAMRQSMLRSRFVIVAAVPRQVIDAAPDVALEVIALEGAAEDQELRLADAVREQASRPFDFSSATPLRWTLFRLDSRRFALLRVWHDILGDALSARLLQEEVSDAYAAARAGRDPTFAPLPIEYADYAVWQAQDQQRAAALEPQLAFWKERLDDLPVLALPTDFRRPPTQSFLGGTVTSTLPYSAAQALKVIGRMHGATTFVSFLAAFSTLLSRLSGDTDLAIGTPIAGRTLPELAPVIGYLANTVVFRADLAGSPSVEELLARTRDGVRDMLRHQDFPFKELVDVLTTQRDASRNPLFQVAFAMREYDRFDLRFAGAEVRRVDTELERAKFDLTLTLIEWPDRIDAHWEYCSALFARSTIERISRQYALLVGAMAAHPTQSVATLPMMDEATRKRLAGAASRTASTDPATVTIAERFAAQARKNPGAMAIESLDYVSLDAAANRLARALRAQGVASGSIVAVAHRRSMDTAVAWLAVLKAGAAYLPIDPDLPPKRVKFMLADARVAHAVADDSLSDLFADSSVCVIRPARDSERIATQAAHAPDIVASPSDAAYVIYTSGSTGSPKGVVIPHRAVLRLVCDTDCAQLGPTDSVAQIANPAFDASTFEFWGALLNGARIVPVTKTTAIAPRALAATIASEHVTALFLTTALFNAVAREAPEAFRSCRYVLFGGEAADPLWVAEVMRAGPPCHLLHVYGPTETTTFATWHEVRDAAPNAVSVPIGHPLANTDLFVLRPDFELAAPGEPGEIWIGGPGLAVGYLNASEQLGARFVDHAVAHLPKRRLYRSGDRARWSDDGTVEFLGRRDRQVKIRGHRIELEEIEAIITRLPQVRAAVVEVRGESVETRQLVAYLVRTDPSEPPPDILWSDLRTMLPEYMLPGSIVWLQTLPLTASGKIDRRALPAITELGSPRAPAYVAPRDMVEQSLVRIWEKLLKIEKIGVFDHFFEIGGHSLMAARLVDEIECETGLETPLAVLFADDTIAGIARALREGSGGLDAALVTINDSGALPPFVFVHGALNGGGFYSRSLAYALGPERPVVIVHPHGPDGSPIPGTIEEMASDRIRALREHRPRGPYFIGGYCNGAYVAFEIARQLMQAGEQVPVVILIEARAPRRGSNDGSAAGDSFVTFDRHGGFRVLSPHDRRSETQLRYLRAIDLYAGGPYAGHIVVVRSRRLDDLRPELGWAQLASSAETHILPGDHVTLLTRHVGELANVTRAAIEHALERPADSLDA
jgi:amino acid adenylation domain-containing protein